MINKIVKPFMFVIITAVFFGCSHYRAEHSGINTLCNEYSDVWVRINYHDGTKSRTCYGQVSCEDIKNTSSYPKPKFILLKNVWYKEGEKYNEQENKPGYTDKRLMKVENITRIDILEDNYDSILNQGNDSTEVDKY